MASSQAPTSVAMMTAAFPPLVEAIVGVPNLQDLIRLQDSHMIPCAQSHVTTNHTLNYIHRCVPANIFTQYTNEAYPDIPDDPGTWDGGGKETPLGRTQARADWEVLNMELWDTQNMNRALTNRFLSHLSAPILPAFQSFFTQNPNMVFGQVFQWFWERYGVSNETERHENCTRMEADWSFDEGVETLIN